MNCLLGIEGGGTKSLMRLTDTSGRTIAESVGKGLNIYILKKEEVKENIKEMYEEILKQIDFIPNIQSACIGAAGVVSDNDISFYTNTISEAANCNKVSAYTDAHIALFGHLGNLPGMSITSGTGSICIGKDKEGNTIKCGGWGHIFGDEGSAYDIAKNSLKHIFNCYDTNTDTLLYSEFLKATNTNNIYELLTYVYKANKSELAALSKHVDLCADMEDHYAIDVLNEASISLFELLEKVAKNLNFNKNTDFAIVFNGSVLSNSKFVNETLTKKLKEEYINCSVIDPINDAVSGAIYLLVNSHL